MITWVGKSACLPLWLALGGQDSNPQQQDQNLPCYQLHHPPKTSSEGFDQDTGE
jgi:hypothetical protein